MIRTATATMSKVGDFVEVEVEGETVARTKDGNGFIGRIDRQMKRAMIARQGWESEGDVMVTSVRIF